MGFTRWGCAQSFPDGLCLPPSAVGDRFRDNTTPEETTPMTWPTAPATFYTAAVTYRAWHHAVALADEIVEHRDETAVEHMALVAAKRQEVGKHCE